jgi:hypothetical protein
VSIDVAAPVQLYDAFHAAVVEHSGGRLACLLAHVAWQRCNRALCLGELAPVRP